MQALPCDQHCTEALRIVLDNGMAFACMGDRGMAQEEGLVYECDRSSR